MTVRVVVVDDHPVVRAGLTALLGAATDVDVLAEAADADSAVDAVQVHEPDVVVMDLNLPGMQGDECTRRIKDRWPSTRVLVLTMDEEAATIQRAIRAGATGYVLKGADPIEVVRAVEAVARGQLVFGAGIADKAASHISAATYTDGPLAVLTDRERQVLELIAEGLTNVEIARRLGMQPKTARNHVSNVLTKLNAADRHDAARIADKYH